MLNSGKLLKVIVLAATILQRMNFYDDVRNKNIADLGCGCGILTVGCVVLDCGHCTGFEIDEDALEICQRNLQDLEIENTDLVKFDITKINPGDSKWHNKFDTILMNPPFGTKKNEGIDVHFLKVALTMAETSVYSLHKASTIDYLQATCNRLGVKLTIEDRFPDYCLEDTYRCHKKNLEIIDVVLIRCSFSRQKDFFLQKVRQYNVEENETCG